MMSIRVLLFLAPLLLFAELVQAQESAPRADENTLSVHFVVGAQERQVNFEIGQRLKVDLFNGERVKGVIEQIEDNSIILSGRRVAYTDIAIIKNRGVSNTGSKVMGGAAVTGAVVSGLIGLTGLAIATSENLLIVVLGVAIGLTGAVGLIYSGIVLAAASTVALSSKVINVTSHKAEFRVHAG